MLGETKIEGFPWPIFPALIGFLVAFFIQFRLKYHADREKVLQLEDMSQLYTQGLPPRNILTERGRRLYFWLYFGMGLFALGLLLSGLFYSK
ncbi:MAG: hypothetical protein ACJ8NS_05255 [Chthoniobacterales bacterium]